MAIAEEKILSQTLNNTDRHGRFLKRLQEVQWLQNIFVSSLRLSADILKCSEQFDNIKDSPNFNIVGQSNRNAGKCG